MKKLLLLLPLFLLAGVLSAQSGQLQKPPSLEDQTSLYPCPAKSTDDVKLTFAQPVLVSSVKLVRSDGWSPNGGWFNPPQNQQLATLTLPKLSSGFYTLRLAINGGKFISKKIIVYR